jgi:hypothetical protein
MYTRLKEQLKIEPNFKPRMKIPELDAGLWRLIFPTEIERREFNETVDVLRAKWLWEDHARQNLIPVRVHPREHWRYNEIDGSSRLSQSAGDCTDDGGYDGLL